MTSFAFCRFPCTDGRERIVNFAQIVHIAPSKNVYDGAIEIDRTEIHMSNGDILTVLVPFYAVEQSLITLAAQMYSAEREK